MAAEKKRKGKVGYSDSSRKSSKKKAMKTKNISKKRGVEIASHRPREINAPGKNEAIRLLARPTRRGLEGKDT